MTARNRHGRLPAGPAPATIPAMSRCLPPRRDSLSGGLPCRRLGDRKHKNDVRGGVSPVSTDDGGLSTNERQRLKELERENRELRRSNDILRQASAYFAQAELDRHWKK